MQKIDWELLVERSYTPLGISFNNYLNSVPRISKYIDVNLIDTFLCDGLRCMNPKGTKTAIRDAQVKGYRAHGASYLAKLAKDCLRVGDNLISKAKAFSKKDFSALDQSAISEFRDIMEDYREFSVFLYTVLSLDDWFGEELMRVLKDKVSDELLLTYERLSLPIKHNVAQEEQKSLLRIAANMKTKEGSEIKDLINTHLKDYGWLQIRWFEGDFMTEQQLLERISKIDDPAAQLKELETNPENIKAEMEKLAKKYGFSQDEMDFVDVVKEYVFLRTYRTDTMNLTNYYLMPFLEAASKRLQIPIDDMVYLTAVELITALEKGLPDNIDIAKRKESWLIVRDKEEQIVYQGTEEVNKFLDEQGIIEKDFSQIKELTGKTAFKGNISGPAKIVDNPDDIGKVQKGDILIAVMTFPSYIVAMEKAAAFVTDEGSILCHAAIVAREMRKPCVISTRIATKVFKDGDIIHVDADKGIVRMLT